MNWNQDSYEHDIRPEYTGPRNGLLLVGVIIFLLLVIGQDFYDDMYGKGVDVARQAFDKEKAVPLARHIKYESSQGSIMSMYWKQPTKWKYPNTLQFDGWNFKRIK